MYDGSIPPTKTLLQFDPGEVPNNVTQDQALKLGLIPPVTADGQDDYLEDTGTSVTSFEQVSK